MTARGRLHAALDRPLLHRLAAAVPPARNLARRLASHGDGSLVLTSGPVRWEGLAFAFTAPLKDHRSARTRGTENIICRILRHTVEPGATVLDVGASYGFVTLVAGLTVGPGGRVISVEQDPAVAAVLRATVDENDLVDRVRVVGAAAGRAGAEVTVDELVADDDRLGFVKIDTDGTDLAVLEGAELAVDRHQPVLAVELAADQEAILTWLRRRYPAVVDQFGAEITAPPWPPNAIALPETVTWRAEWGEPSPDRVPGRQR